MRDGTTHRSRIAAERYFNGPAWRRRVAERRLRASLQSCIAQGFERATRYSDSPFVFPTPEPDFNLAAVLKGNGAILCVDCDGIEARTRAALETAIGATLDNLTFLRRYAGEDDATFRARVISKL